MLPAITVNSPTGCFNTASGLSLETSDPMILTGTWPNQKVVPTDISAHAKYTFFLKFTFKGGKITNSNQMTLEVGCSLAAAPTTASTFAATQNADILLNSATTGRYIYPPPVPDPNYSYCDIVSTVLIDRFIDTTSTTSAADVNCVQPCYTVDLGTGTTSAL